MSYKTIIAFTTALIISALSALVFAPKLNYKTNTKGYPQIIAEENLSAIAGLLKPTDNVASKPKEAQIIYSDKNYEISLVCQHDECKIGGSNKTDKIDLRIIDFDKKFFVSADIDKRLFDLAFDLDIFVYIKRKDRAISAPAAPLNKIKDAENALEIIVYQDAIGVNILEFEDKELLAKLKTPPAHNEYNISNKINHININGIQRFAPLQ